MSTTDLFHYMHKSCKTILYSMLLQLVKQFKEQTQKVSKTAFGITFFIGNRTRNDIFFYTKNQTEKQKVTLVSPLTLKGCDLVCSPEA